MKQLLLILLAVSLYACDYIGKPVVVMPDFKVLNVPKSDTLYTKEIPTGKPILFFYFGTECPHCQALTDSITHRMDELKDTRIYFISGSSLPDILDYRKKFHLDSFSNVTVSRDYSNYFVTNYKAPGYPYLVIFDQKKRFQQIVLGEVRVDTLKAILHPVKT